MNFQNDVIKASETQLVIVDFYADWCGPCKMLTPILDKLCNQLNIKLVKLNTEDNLDLCDKYEVKGIPDLRLFSAGKQISSSVGFKSFQDLKTWVETSIKG